MNCEVCGKELRGVSLAYFFYWRCSDCNREDVIHSEAGTKLAVETFDAGYSYDKELAEKYLEFGKEYTVTSIHVGGSRTEIILKEIPNIEFNSVFFKRL